MGLLRRSHKTVYKPTTAKDIRKFYYNIVLYNDGTIGKLPFDGKRYGIWYFDGQFYFQRLTKRKK